MKAQPVIIPRVAHLRGLFRCPICTRLMREAGAVKHQRRGRCAVPLVVWHQNALYRTMRQAGITADERAQAFRDLSAVMVEVCTAAVCAVEAKR